MKKFEGKKFNPLEEQLVKIILDKNNGHRCMKNDRDHADNGAICAGKLKTYTKTDMFTIAHGKKEKKYNPVLLVEYTCGHTSSFDLV